MADGKVKVTGTYYGAKFEGQAVSSRQLNWNPDYPEQLTIRLSQSLTVLGGTRETGDYILINSREIDEYQHTIKAI